jgi:SAM-dependent methyltransferase
MKLNLGCGEPKFWLDGYYNCDILPHCAQNGCQLDVTELPWLIRAIGGDPVPESSIDEIRADNLLEHLGWDHNGADLLMCVLNESHRVLKPDGQMWFRVPDAERWLYGALRDPTHRRFFVMGTIDYWDADHQTHRNYGSTYGYKPWAILERKIFGGLASANTFIDCTMRPVK